ncbi:beta-hydroxyacyl-ACP dehydratase [Nocardia colli]|uniref:Beta-hydroxyacyl-ACP dehydratase n=1 Tax=Nocardia colli TaxID=2545717 RepID=A0A5N0EAP1_9NOCA|nr:3-hydroxyacyl-ACP dehydratase FabZ family protein [Nocardia colli]KAA8885539.1 beta-hydroxyacyl-ACP dehydratase [Nocardia colli]
MRFLMVDAITELDGGRRAAGVKNAAMSEDYFADHFPQQPILPGVLVLEAMTQLARWLVITGSDFQTTVVLSAVQHSKFIDFAVPGDRLTVEVDRLDGGTPEHSAEIDFRGTAQAHGRKIAVATFRCRSYPLAEFEDPDSTRRHYQVLRLNGTKVTGR